MDGPVGKRPAVDQNRDTELQTASRHQLTRLSMRLIIKGITVTRGLTS